MFRWQAICAFEYRGGEFTGAINGSLHATAGGKPLLIDFEVSIYRGIGTYETHNTDNIVTLDGPTRWVSGIGDRIEFTRVDELMASGSLDSTLSDGSAGPVRLTGNWVCDRRSRAAGG